MTKPSVGTAALAKSSVVLEKLLEFRRAHRIAHVVLKEGMSEMHAHLRNFWLSQKTPGDQTNKKRRGYQ